MVRRIAYQYILDFNFLKVFSTFRGAEGIINCSFLIIGSSKGATKFQSYSHESRSVGLTSVRFSTMALKISEYLSPSPKAALLSRRGTMLKDLSLKL